MKINKKRTYILTFVSLVIVLGLSITINFASKLSSNKEDTKTVVKEANVKKEIEIKETRLKDKGKDVEYIQKRLNEYGYTIGTDGGFGWATYNALLDFQNKAGLTISGEADRTTIDALKKPPTPETMYTPQKPIDYTYINSDINKFVNENDIVSYTDYLLVTSLKNRMTYIFKGSTNNYVLIDSFSSTVGASSTPTVTGVFRIGIRGLSFGQDKGFSAKYYTQFSGNYLYHSVIYNKAGTKVTDPRLGKALSSGCIRIPTEKAKWIYDNIPEYTTVIVR
jgi:lipoprotein-anchoring transpeptidase ErfK/SrfK